MAAKLNPIASSQLRDSLPNPETPWMMSPDVFARFKSLPLIENAYKKCLLKPEDPEAAFVHAHFNQHSPTNREIARVWCIHNLFMTRQFEGAIPVMEQEAMNPTFAPNLQAEDAPALRQKAIKRWEAITAPYSPFALEADHGRTSLYSSTKVLPLWHGSTAAVCSSICQAGFTFFGKHQIIHQGAADGQSKDVGFFGSGIYFTDSARYAADIYSDGNLLLSWVSMREPFPVVADKVHKHPGKPLDMKKLEGHHAYKNYNAHYIPVISINPANQKCSIYYPCAEGQEPAWDEIVVFNKAQTLPRFWIELQVALLKNPQDAPATAGQFLKHLLHLLETDAVQNSPEILKIFEAKTDVLIVMDKTVALTPFDQVLYHWTLQLFDEAGKVRNFVKTKLLSLQPPSPASTPGVVQPPLPKRPRISPPKSAPAAAAVQPLIPPQAFGRAKWLQYFGEIGEEPALPPDIQKILQSPCPFWPGKTVQETHMLVLLPKTVNGAPLTLNSLEELVKHPKQGPTTQYRYYWDEAKKALGDQPLTQSSWVLMTKDVLDGSRYKSYADQCKLVESFSQKTGVPYQVPGTLEAAICILLEHVQSGTRLYSDSPYTWTRCHERVAGYPMAVGGFAASGLRVGSHVGDGGRDCVGVSCLRKF